MKLITAVIQPFTVNNVIAALEAVGIVGVTMTEAQGRGRQHAGVEYYRGARYSSPFVAKARLEVLATDAQLEAALDAITQAARTGKVGDGKIWVTEIDSVVRVRTGEKDDAAIAK